MLFVYPFQSFRYTFNIGDDYYPSTFVLLFFAVLDLLFFISAHLFLNFVEAPPQVSTSLQCFSDVWFLDFLVLIIGHYVLASVQKCMYHT